MQDHIRIPSTEDADALAPPYLLSNASPTGKHIIPRLSRTPVIDSLVPVQSDGSVTPYDHKQSTTAVLIIVLSLVGLCVIVAIIFFVRYRMRQAAIKRRRQASWILRSAQWSMESKRNDAHETRTGCSHASSAFSAYPYPLSEHFQ